MNNSRLATLLQHLDNKLSKRDILDLFVVLDEDDDRLYEWLGNKARSYFPEEF